MGDTVGPGKYIRTAATREKQRIAKTGQRHSEETKRKISEAGKGKLSGSENPMWKGGKTLDSGGYVLVKMRDHPGASRQGYVREHRLVMETALGRHLERHEVVHHRNGIKTDNRIENLELMSPSDHRREHNGPLPDETRAKIGAANRAHYGAPENREKQRQRVIVSGVKPPSTKGLTWTPEQRAKITASLTGRKQSPETRAKKSAALKAAWARKRGG
jgi:hypothetical protein